MTQFNATTYDIARPTGVCALTGKQLKPGDPYMATLVESDEPPPGSSPVRGNSKGSTSATTAVGLGFRRMDVSMEAWQQNHRPPKVFSYWRSVVPEPNQKRKLFVDDSVLMDLFKRLADTDQTERRAFRFVLGLVLMRKKLLRYDRTEVRTVADQRQDWWHVTPKLDLSKGPLGKWDDASAMQMLDPKLNDEQIKQVTEQLGQILEAEV